MAFVVRIFFYHFLLLLESCNFVTFGVYIPLKITHPNTKNAFPFCVTLHMKNVYCISN